MNCPFLNNYQSILKGQNRLDTAIEYLGEDVVRKILCFSFYLVGFPHEKISEMFDVSQPGLKLIVKGIFHNGVERFLDKRRGSTYPLPVKKLESPPHPKPPTISYSDTDNSIKIYSTEPILLSFRKDDPLTSKVLVLTLLSSSYLNTEKALEILKCNRQTIHNNLTKFKAEGAKGIIDNRVGQTRDYKYDSVIKAEIIQCYFESIFENQIPTSNIICEKINRKYRENYSKRAIAYHLRNMGLTERKKEMVANIVTNVNNQVNSLTHLQQYFYAVEEGKCDTHLEILKTLKESLVYCSKKSIHENNRSIIFNLEQKTQYLQAQLQPQILKSLLSDIQTKLLLECPECASHDIKVYLLKGKPQLQSSITTSLGGKMSLLPPLGIMCNKCHREFEVQKDLFQLSPSTKFTPLTQKKICYVNRAGSYENAAKVLKELINLDINRNEVRNISNHVGHYIKEEFKKLYKDISNGIPQEIIYQKHPLVEELRIDQRYLNRSDYFITLSIDGGRMQLFNWIPGDKNQKAKKKMHWHENKVFRISIYDKSIVNKVVKNNIQDDLHFNNHKVYESASILPGLTTYGATNATWKDTAPLIQTHLYIRGIKPSDVQICISDGSDHIMREIFTPYFSQSIHILDYYHKNEALHRCLKLTGMLETKLEKRLKNYLWEGKTIELIDELREIQKDFGIPYKGKRNIEDPKIVLDNFINHLHNNKNRIKYDEYRKNGYPIGSGCIESAVKLFGKRVKGTEKQWNDNGGEAILHLYAFLLSEDKRWDKLWTVNTPWK